MQQKGWIREAGRYRALWVKFRRDVRAQDLIEYALMAGFIAVASAAVMPQICEQHQHGLLENQFGHGFHRGQLKRYGGLAESVAWAPLARDFSRAEMMRLRATTSIKTGGSNMTFVLSAGS